MSRDDNAGADIYQHFNNGNALLRQFYLTHLMSLLHVLMADLPAHIVRYVAIKLRDPTLFENDWREQVFIMGVQNNDQIATIAAAAEARREMPLYIAMREVLSNRSYAQLINALLQLERYDILQYLESYTRRLLDLVED